MKNIFIILGFIIFSGAASAQSMKLVCGEADQESAYILDINIQKSYLVRVINSKNATGLKSFKKYNISISTNNDFISFEDNDRVGTKYLLDMNTLFLEITHSNSAQKTMMYCSSI